MNYENEGAILDLIKAKEDDLNDLRQQWEDDFKLYTLEEYVPDDDSDNKIYEKYTSSQPRNFFDKVMDALTSAEISIQIKLADDAKQKDRDAASLGELYLFGALAAIDRRLRNMGEPPLRNSMSFLASLRGWIAQRALVYVEGKQTVFDVSAWDIMHTTWEAGSNGLLWAANKRKITKAQLYSEYGEEISSSEATLVDFWDEEINAIIVNDKFVKEPEAHEIGHVPVYVASVGSMPSLQDKNFKSTLPYRGDSVWSSSRKLYKPFNKLVSRTMDIYERAVVGSILHYSKGGDKKIVGDPYKTFQEINLDINKEEDIKAFPVNQAPAETAVLHSIVNTDIQTSTLPYPLAYGGTKQAMSGAALGVLADATRSVYSPRTQVLSQAYTWLCEELLSQFKNNGAKSKLEGYDSKEHFFSVNVKPNNIDPSWFVNVEVRPKMPRDRESEVMMALSATAKRAADDIPLVSKRTAREDIMKIRDPDAEERRVLEEMGMGLPPIMATNIAKALKDAGRPEMAQDVMALMNPNIMRPYIPPEVLAAATEALGRNPETQPLAQLLSQAMSGGQQGTPQTPQGG
ncbi:MAG: hypothetical protein H3Z50_07740 [archaeon]|nr:hypothetical protein [archaeon]